jgi:hypothetical protein
MRMAGSLFVTLLASLAPVVAAADQAPAKAPAAPPSAPLQLTTTTLDVSKPLPTALKVKGKRTIAVYQWAAPTGGDGYLVLSSTETKGKRGPGRDLFVQIYGGKKPREVRLVKDGQASCALDLTASFVAGSVAVMDVDADGTPEVSVAYDLGCDATERPTPRKLILVEGATKHAMRGAGMGKDPDGKPLGGEVAADGFKKEAALLGWATDRWKTLLAVAPRAVDE